MKNALILLASVLTVGCSTTSNMAMNDLNHFKVDCNNQEAQLAQMRSMLPRERDRAINALVVTGPVGYVRSHLDGTFEERKAVYDRRQQAVIRDIIFEIEHYCPPPKPKPQGCMTVFESMPSGESQGKRCYQAGKPTPVVNNWEALVD